jgi:2-C-methyl-D-erythritol 4-phosphate cytidylyltransferase
MTVALKIAAIIPAAGVGSRMQLSYPKQYLDIHGLTVLEHTVGKLTSLSSLSHILIAVSEDDAWFPQLTFSDPRIARCTGGASRAESVRNALLALKGGEPDWVLVHDAARPLVTPADIQALIERCVSQDQGGILAAKVKDTIKEGGALVSRTVPREHLWSALTPQMFKYRELLSALESGLEQAPETITDEASAMERLDYPVQLVAGRSDNIKITSPEDYDLACYIMNKQRESR